MKIITAPNPLLYQKSKTVTKIDKQTLKFINNLNITLQNTSNPPGVGLSAIQVGKPLRIFCIKLPNHKIQTYINPQIIQKSHLTTLKVKPACRQDRSQKSMVNGYFAEGCLSIPNIYGPVKRHKWIKLKWQMANGQRQMAKFVDFEARVIQHEYDHLNGILFIDHSLKDDLPLYEQNSKGRLCLIKLLP